MEGALCEEKLNEISTECEPECVAVGENNPDSLEGHRKKSDGKNDEVEANSKASEDLKLIDGDRLSIQSGINDDDLLEVRLLGVLGTDDLEGTRQLIKKYNLDDAFQKPKSFGSPLHLAVLASSFIVLKALIDEYPHCAIKWINTQDASEHQTALHVAAKNGNYEAVCLFLELDGVDETVQDCEYRTPSDLSSTRQISLKFKAHKESFVEELKAFVAANVDNKDNSRRIIQRFNTDSRAREYLRLGWFDINSPLLSFSDQNILHIASRYNNNELVEWALALGSDANVKDSRGRRAIDFASKKNPSIRQKLLAAAPLEQKFLSGNIAVGSMIDHSDNMAEKELPVLRDTLFKWTNYASGFRPRFFVIENGVLYYYKTAADYPNACKGSVNLATCKVEISNKDSTRLEVYVDGRDRPHYIMQAKSQVYAKQWFWAMVQSKLILNGRSANDNASHQNNETSSRDKRLSSIDISHDKWPASDNSTSAMQIDSTQIDAFTLLSYKQNDIQALKTKLSSNLSTIINMVNLTWEKLEPPLDVDSAQQKITFNQGLLSPDITNTLKNMSQQLTSTVNELLSIQKERENNLVNFYERKLRSMRLCEDRLNKMVDDIREKYSPLEHNDIQTHQIQKDNVRISDVRIDDARIDANSNSQDRDFRSSVSSTGDNVSDDIFYNTESVLEPLKPPLDNNSNYEDVKVDVPEQPVSSITESGNCSRNSTRNSSVLETDSVDIGNRPDNSSVQFKNPFIPITSDDVRASSLGYPTKEGFRDKLPLDPQKPKPALHIWSFIKSSIGKDLSRITVPVFFNEPLSTLQRLCEDVSYIELLTLASRVGSDSTAAPRITDSLARSKASALNMNYSELIDLDPVNAAAVRSLLVSVFAVSSYSSTERVAKPFNPLLGETFELSSKEKSYRYITEQVSHHPPISASHCESPDYCMSTEAHMKSKFWGKTFEITPAGYTHLLLAVPRSQWPSDSTNNFGIEHGNIEDAKRYGLAPYQPDVYCWKKVSTYVTNFVFGKMKLENRGTITVTNRSSGIVSTITFVKQKSGFGSYIPGWSTSGAEKSKSDVDVTIKGTVLLENGECAWEMIGNHFKSIYARPSPEYACNLPPSLRNGFLAWEAEPYPADSKNNYDFTYTAIALNQISPELKSYLPLTDSRLRPDQRYMENGMWDEASVFKEALEMYQRKNRSSLVALYSQTKRPCQRPKYDEILNSIHSENRAEHIGESWWRPRWFVNCYDPFTKENYWRFTGDYWNWRKSLPADSIRDSSKEYWPSWIPSLYDQESISSLIHDISISR